MARKFIYDGCKYICDGCGKEAPGYFNGSYWHKPALWFERSDEDGEQLACSRDCIKTVAKTTGKTELVVPL